MAYSPYLAVASVDVSIAPSRRPWSFDSGELALRDLRFTKKIEKGNQRVCRDEGELREQKGGGGGAFYRRNLALTLTAVANSGEQFLQPGGMILERRRGE